MKKKKQKITNLINRKYKYQLLENGFSKKDISIGRKVLNSRQITMASYTRKFEISFAKKIGANYALMVNSGSSANLLALASLNLKKGSEIITPNLTFSTTVAPIYQLGLIPHFVGAEENKFITDPNQIEKCINKKNL